MTILNKLRQKAKKLKSEAQVLLVAYKDKRTPRGAKILIGLTVGYLLSPVDLIPDFIPVLGVVDDLIIVPALIALSIRLIPNNVLIEAREAVLRKPQQLKKTNWIFAAVIIVIWLFTLTFLYKVFQRWLGK